MTDPIDVAYVEIRADGSKFGPDVVANVDREMSRSGKAIKDSITKPVVEAGKQSQSIFAGIGQSISNGLRPGVAQVQNFRAGFSDSRAAASAFTGQMGTLGGAVRAGMQPGITAAQNLAAGFMNSDAAASAFTGRMGTVGGAIRNAVQPAISLIDRAKLGLTDFRAGFDSTQAAASAFTGRMGSLGGVARSTWDTATMGVTNFRAGLSSSDAAQSAFTGRMGSLGGAINSTFRNGQTVVRDFGNIGSDIASRIGTAFESASDRMRTRFTSAINSMKGVALTLGGALGVGGIGALIGSGISRISDIEQTTKSLQVMTGSAQKAQSVMSDLLTFAKSTPFSFPDISQIGRNMIAFGVDTEKVVPTLRALGDAASASGQGTAAMQQLGNAIGSVAIAGKISGVDLESFQAVGVPALKILANTAGVSASEMSNRISKGTVDSKFAIDSLVKGIENGTNGIAGQTARMGGIMASQKDTIVGTMDSFKSSVTSTMATLLTPAIPLMRQGVTAIGNEFKKLPAFIASISAQLKSLGFFEAIRNLFAGIANVISAVWPALQTFGRVFLTVFGAGVLATLRAFGVVFQWVGDHIRQFLPIIQPIAAVLGALWGATVLLRGAMMLAGGAMLVWKGIMVAFGPIVKVFTALQWALDAAMDANPISLIIIAIVALVAAFVILWNKSASFRQFWITLWQTISSFFIGVWNTMKSVFTTVIDALKTAWNATWKFISDVISAVWNGFLKPVFDAISTAVHAVGDAAQWLWSTILQPVFNFIGAAAVIMGKIILGVVLIPLVAFWKLILAPTIEAFGIAFKAVFDGIQFVISLAWNNVIKPVFDFIANVAIPAVVNAFHWLWHYGVENPWNEIKLIISTAWNTFIKPIFDFIENVAIPAIVNAFHWLWHYGVENPWNMIKQIISDAWNTFIKPIFDFISNIAIPAVVNAFHWLWHYGVENPWNEIKAIINAGWNFISPIFDAIKNGIGKVGDAFSNAKDFVGRVWDQLGEIAMKPIRFIVNTVLDDGLINGWNKVVDFLHLSFLHIPEIPRLATGGIVPGYTPGRDTHAVMVGGGEAVMRPEWTRAAGSNYVNAANAAARTGGVSGAGAFIAQNGLPGFASGGIVGWIGNALNSVGGFLSGAFNGLLNFGGEVLNFVTDPVGGMEKLLNGILGGLNLNIGDVGRFAELALQAPKGLVTGLVQKIKDWWTDFTKSSANVGGGGGAQRWAPLVLQALSMLGQPASLLPNVLRRMNQESGGNPNAINNTDINAQRGDPSRGLMQTIGSTFAAYRNPALPNNIYDPLANIYAGLNYAIHRYPSLQFAMDKPGGYDNGGGLPPGLSTVWNGTGQVENVRSPAEEDETNTLLRRMAERLDELGSRTATVVVNAVLDGKIMQTWFQETEILGGL